ncbi:MAG: hypothetical protein ACPG7U_01790 [Holosporaceae bacterium]
MKKTMLALVVLLQGVSTLSAVPPSAEVTQKNTEIALLKKHVAQLKDGLKWSNDQIVNLAKIHEDCQRSVQRLKAQCRAEINRLRAQLAGGEGGHH